MPGAIGARAGSLPHKASVAMHQLRLEVASEADLQAVLGKVVVWTTDLGAEVGIADCTADGCWGRLSATFGGAGLVADAGELELDGSRRPDRPFIFDRALPIPGVCHIVGNLSHDVHTAAMAAWPRFEEHLTALASLL